MRRRASWRQRARPLWDRAGPPLGALAEGRSMSAVTTVAVFVAEADRLGVTLEAPSVFWPPGRTRRVFSRPRVGRPVSC